MKRIPITQLREMLDQIYEHKKQVLGLLDSNNPKDTDEASKAATEALLISAINLAFEGDATLLRTYLPEEPK